MNLAGKLALTVVMVAIGVAPALALAADPFRPGGERAPEGPGPSAPSSPGPDPVQRQDEPPAEESDRLIVAIPQTEAEWAAWMAQRTGQPATAPDPADAVDVVEPPVGPDGWVYDDPEDSGWVYDEPEESGWVYDEPEESGWIYEDPQETGTVPADPAAEPQDEAVGEPPVEGDEESGDGLLGILG